MRNLAIIIIGITLFKCSPAHATLEMKSISFKNDNIILRGDLLLPDGHGPFPGLVMVHGSGIGERSELMEIAKGFAEYGIAVLVYDKRGSGMSDGSWINSSLVDLAEDAAAAFNFLISQHNIQVNSSGYWGVSQGGWVVPLAAGNTSPKFTIIVTGGGVAPKVVETDSYRSIVARIDKSKIAESEINQILLTYFSYLIGTASHSMLIEKFEEFHNRPWFKSTGIERVVPSENNRENWRWVADFNPETSIKQLDIPVLVLLGSNDQLTPTSKTEQAWRNNLPESSKHNLIHVFLNADHGLRTGHHGGQFVKGYFEFQINWLRSIGVFDK